MWPRVPRCLAEPRIGWVSGIICLLGSFGSSVNAADNSFRVIEVTLAPSGPLTVRHESRPTSYYILHRGQNVTDIRMAVDLALGNSDTGFLQDASPPHLQRARFYQVLEIPLHAPFDSDRDGIDDVTELRLAFLNPLDPADADADFDGDGRSNLDEYRNGTDLAVPDPDLLTVLTSTSPAHRETGVAVTRETVFRFSYPLAPSTLLTSNEVFAQFAGTNLPARIALSSNRRKLTLFYHSTLPSSARIRVTLRADSILDAFGLAVDADGDGLPGGTASVDFETLSLDTVPGTLVCGRVFASELAPAGSGLASVNVPLAGVTITVDGAEQSMRAVTDAFGDFRLDPAPAGRFFVHIDGRTASNSVPSGAYYPFVGKAWQSVAGEEVNIGNVYLPLVAEGTLQPVTGADVSPVTFPDAVLAEHPELAGTTLFVPPDNLFADDGTVGGMIGMAPVPPDRLPGTLPLGLAFPLVITVQTDGASNFDEPVPICFPNLPDPQTGQLLLPGAKSALFSFNHDTGRFEMAGSMTVSADGQLVCTDPGVGIPAPGWHGVLSVSVGGVPFTFHLSCQENRILRAFLRDGGSPEELPESLRNLLPFVAQGGLINVTDDCPPPPPSRPRNTSTVAKECKGRNEHCPCDGACSSGKGSETPSGPPGAGTPAGKRVFLHNGEEVFDRVDLAIPGRGDIHFALQRTYRSQIDFNGPLGHGWNYNFNEALFFEDNGDVTRSLGDSHVATWERQLDGTYLAPAGYYSSLTRRADGTFRLRQPDGFLHFYRPDGRLFCYQDRHGNQMLLDYDEFGNLDVVIDPFGREIDFVFEAFPDGVDRLTRVIDFIGREIVYAYDANFDLVEVRTPVVTGTSTGNDFPNGRTERYTYSSGFAQPELNHNLLSVTYPEEVARGGPPALVWTYGEDPANPLTFDRVLTETEGGTNASGIPAGGTMSFAYERLNEAAPPGNPDLPRGKVTVTERNGNVYEFFANELNHHILTRRPTRGLRPGEPAFYETRSIYDEDGQLVRRVFPEGNEIRYVYDRAGPRAAHRNLVEMRQVADALRGGGEDLVTTFTYEPLYNRLASVTDPRGHAADFVPPLGMASAARYTTRYFYDYQESNGPVPQAVNLGLDLSSAPRGLGDLNQDGRTDQVAGNLVRVEAPAVTLRPEAHEAARLGATRQPILTQIQWNDRGQRRAVIDPEGNVHEWSYHPENDPDGGGQPHTSPYLAVTAEPTGYLRARIVDSRTSPRRSSPTPPVALETRYTYDPVGNPVRIRNPRGIEATIEYNQLNEPVTITRGAAVADALASGQLLRQETPLRYQSRMVYDFNGRLVRHETENRDSTTTGVGDFVERTYLYDILHHPVESTVEVDASTTLTNHFRYDPNELPILLVQPEGNQTLTTYDERNLPFRITRGLGSPEASTTQINYDLNANERETLDAEDNDGDGQPERTTLLYDGFDRPIETIDALGNRVVREFDVAGNLVRSRVFGHPPGQPQAPSVLLSDNRFLHDELNRLYQIDETLFLPDGFNPLRPVSLTDQDGDGLVTSRFEYDALSRNTFRIEDDLQVSRLMYDGASRPVEQVDHLGNRLRTFYDQNANPILIQSIELSPENLVPQETFATHLVYDQLDRLVRATDNAGQTARFEYDSRDNLILRADPQGAPMPDPLGLFPGPINQPGNTVSWFYDGLDRRVLQVTDLRQDGQGGLPLDLSNHFNPDGQIHLSLHYDGNSRLASIVDDNGNRTRFEYDALNRRIRQVNADLEAFVIAYDRDDNPRQVTDPNGTTVHNTYDALHRLTRVDVTRAPGIGGTTNLLREYDGLSRLTRVLDDNGSATASQECAYVYDSLSRILEERQNGQAISTTWSGDGKRLACTYPGGRTLVFTHDPIDRVKTVADMAVAIGECFWIGPGLRELHRLHGNATRLSFLDEAGTADIGYDAVQRVARLRHLLPGGQPLADRQYGYNRADMRTFERRLEHLNLTDHYAYDSAYRITQTRLDQNGDPGAQLRDLRQLDYRHDGVGNRRERDRTPTGGDPVTNTYSVNAMNEYQAIDGLDRIHDANGNLTDDGIRLLTYDYQNRLVEVRDKASGNLVARYAYFADNRRARKTVYNQAQPDLVDKETTFFYDGWQVVEEQDGADGQTEVTYVYGQTYIDDLLQMQRTAQHPLGAGTFYYHQNARYDVIAVTDETGAVVEEVLYDDFGNPTLLAPNPAPTGGDAPDPKASEDGGSSGPDPSADASPIPLREASAEMETSAAGNPLLFHGRRRDGETGFLYFRHRYYDPVNGRFLQRDPMWDGHNAGNAYTFAGNNPATLSDPSGEIVPLVAAAALGAAIVLVSKAASPSEEQVAAKEKLAAIEARRARQRHEAHQQALRAFAARCAQGGPIPKPLDLGGGPGPQMYGEGHWKFQMAQIRAAQDYERWRIMVTYDIYLKSWGAAPAPGNVGGARVPKYRPNIRPGSARSVSFNIRRAKQMGISRSIESTRTPLEILGPADHMRGLAPYAKSKPGYTDVFVHGSPHELSIRMSEQRMEPLDLVAFEILAREAGLGQGPIRLVSCETGSIDAGVAQQIANTMGVQVMAPKQRVTVEPASGRIVIADGPAAGRSPTWMHFWPQGH